MREYKKHIGEPAVEAAAQGLEIKVLGPGCPQCEHLEREVMAAISELGISAEFEHVRDLADPYAITAVTADARELVQAILNNRF